MNPFIASVFFGVVTILTVVSAQQATCGCAPQPTIIQMTCGGATQQAPVTQPQPPPPPPSNNAGTTVSPVAPPAVPDPTPEEMMTWCQFDKNGIPTGTPPGGFPAGFRMGQDASGNPMPVLPPGVQLPTPPENWDGRPETLGFQMPQPGTPMYNMLICIPIPVITPG